MQPKTPTDSASVLVHWAGPTDSNSAGNVHGGVILKLIDEAAAVAGARHSRQRVVTAGFDRVSFQSPVAIGELITLNAVVTAAWHTSMEIAVRVEAESPREGIPRHTCTAYVTIVALGEASQPVPVPQLTATNPDEELRMREAELRRENRLAERRQIELGRQPEQPLA